MGHAACSQAKGLTESPQPIIHNQHNILLFMKKKPYYRPSSRHVCVQSQLLATSLIKIGETTGVSVINDEEVPPENALANQMFWAPEWDN